VAIPDTLQVGAAYGVTVREGAPAAAGEFARGLLAPPAQAVLTGLGFSPP